MNEQQFFRPDRHYSTQELEQREQLTQKIVENLAIIGANSIDLEQLERRVAAIASCLRLIADDPIVAELDEQR